MSITIKATMRSYAGYRFCFSCNRLLCYHHGHYNNFSYGEDCFACAKKRIERFGSKSKIDFFLGNFYEPPKGYIKIGNSNFDSFNSIKTKHEKVIVVYNTLTNRNEYYVKNK